MIDTSECTEYLEKVREFARAINKEKQLEEKLEYLASYACTKDDNTVDLEKTHCLLYKDWAAQSFGFTMEIRQKDGTYKYWFSGGLIWYDAGDTGVGVPQYSVRLNTSESGWSINT